MKNANEIREKWTGIFKETLEQLGEDVGLIATNCLNIPVVSEDGEEGFLEILLRVPKDSDGFEKREDFELKELEKIEKEKVKAELKKKKMERDQKRREEKKKIEEEGEE